MKNELSIGILGWGSLIWDPKELLFEGDWYLDGPSIPIEFARISDDKRLTLVVKQNSKLVKCLWAKSSCSTLQDAINNLSQREGMPNNNRIGFVNHSNNTHSERNMFLIPNIQTWLKHKKLDAVIWTDLGVKFRDAIEKEFNLTNIIEYLKSLDAKSQKLAKEYIINAPSQIKTEYREEITKQMNWG